MFLLSHADFRYLFGINNDSFGEPDFTFFWYRSYCNVLLSTFLIALTQPQIDFLLLYLVKTVQRKNDRGWLNCCKLSKTKQTSLMKYVQLYSGPEYQIFYKYTYLLKLVFFCFMYGMAMPIVFPIALLGMLNFFAFEKICLAYFHKKPPSYDSKINKIAVQYLRIGPFVGIAVSWWILGNQQMFDNKIEVVYNIFSSYDP